MFTGIVDHCGTITDIKSMDHGIRIQVSCEFTDIRVGESIATNGICLTAIEPSVNVFFAELSPETLALTDAKRWTVGSKVNIERSLQLHDRLGGHFVMGHVDTTAILQNIEQQGEYKAYEFSGLPVESVALLVKKGSVAVNGVSLTINYTTSGKFSVMLIPHSLATTNLGELRPGDCVNVEYDYFARIIAKQLEHMRTA